jgi:hypothetical protein
MDPHDAPRQQLPWRRASGYDCTLTVPVKTEEETVSMKRAIVIAFFCCIIPVSAVQQTPGMGAQAANSQAGMASAAENAQLRQMAATHGDDTQALRDDIKKMRALVRQMESNLAFVDTTQSPLKHQFQLDIDMWKMVIDHLERRVQGSAR